ncbi:GAPDHS isoform 2 [Pan troglodytes]|uniref:Glyceraldehyde-3-phosphate dehydrogenase, spermatogenic n=3 Tax=Hominidae TaxID=9604 RepID=K7EMB2_HUMAN|nr:GAPDHS isoform 2 [Pan troglodytes]PNJ11160.1 GAPDHS isoform 2 [Pongo abelii]
MSKRDIVLTNVTVVQLLRQPCPDLDASVAWSCAPAWRRVLRWWL